MVKSTDANCLSSLSASFAALASKLPEAEAGKFAVQIAQSYARRIHQMSGTPNDTFEQLVTLLAADRLLGLLKQPGCTEAGRAVLLVQLGKHYKRTFRTVWELVEYVEGNDPGRNLAKPMQRKRQTPKPVNNRDEEIKISTR